MSFVTVKLSGVSASIGAFEHMKNATRNRIVRKSATAGTQPQLVAARRSNAFRNRLGLLRKSFGKKVRTYKSGITVGVVGPRRGFRSTGRLIRWNQTEIIDPVRYAHLVEHGHGGPRPASPKRFMKQAFNHSRGQATDRFSSKFSVEVMAEAAKAAAKAIAAAGRP